MRPPKFSQLCAKVSFIHIFFGDLQIESHGPDGPDTPVQQYVNPWGGPYFPPNYSNMPIPWNPYGQPPYGQSPYGPIAFAPVQTEYGILVPDIPPHHDSPHHDSIVSLPPPPPPSAYPGDLIDLVKDLVPRSLVFLLAKWSAFIVSLFSLVAFGGIITTAICSFTPLCTISFAALPFAALRNSIVSTQDGNGSIDRVRRAAQFVSSAIEKYEKLQQAVSTRKSKAAQN